MVSLIPSFITNNYNWLMIIPTHFVYKIIQNYSVIDLEMRQ
jgi:hypothetical protein